MKYNEALYKEITETDFDDKDEVIELVQYLAAEVLRYHKVAMANDKELQNRMTFAEYNRFTDKMAMEMVEDDMARLPDDNEFKQFFEANKDMIFGKDVNEE